MSDSKTFECSFCGKKKHQVKKLIDGGNDVCICDECITICARIIVDDTPNAAKEILDTGKVPTPREIKEHLDQYIIGQDHAKMVVSVAVNEHYKRLANPIVDDVELEKSNILLLGPSGSGKTLIAQTVAKLLDVPLAIADATSITEAGYVGDDVETIVTRLLHVANFDIKKAERGIIYIDEVDKKARKSEGTSITRDVSGEGVQQSLLKLIEGDIVRVPMNGGRKHPNAEAAEVNTKNILFICGGAFVGLDKIIEKRIGSNIKSIGFGAKVDTTEMHINELLSKVEPDDLVSFGMIPEFIGRLPVITHLEELTEDQLIHVLTKPKNAVVKQFQKMFKLEDIELEFDEKALMHIAKLAKDRKTGARGLRSVIEQKLIHVKFELPDLSESGIRKIIIDESTVTNNTKPVFIDKNGTIS